MSINSYDDEQNVRRVVAIATSLAGCGRKWATCSYRFSAHAA